MARDDLDVVLDELRRAGGLRVPERYAAKSIASRVGALGTLVVSALIAVLGGVLLTEATRGSG